MSDSKQEQESVDSIYSLITLRDFVRKHAPGRCEVLSVARCNCLLCQIDDIGRILHQQAARIAELEAEVAELKVGCEHPANRPERQASRGYGR